MGINLLNTVFMDILQYAFYIIIALAVLMIMITIHEFGHFIVGKKLGFKINEFAIGFGKALYKRTTKTGMIFSIRIVPLGGYCAFDGEDSSKEEIGSFNSMKPWKRLLVLFSGAFFNFLFAIITFFILLMTIGYSDIVQVTKIDTISATTNLSQLQKDDVIYKVGDVDTNFVYDNYFPKLLQDYKPGEDVVLNVKRNGEKINIVIQNGRQINTSDISSTVKKIEFSETDSLILDFTDGNLTLSGEGATKLNKINIHGEDYYEFTYQDDVYFIKANDYSVYTASLGASYKNYKYSFGEALAYCVPFTFEWAWKILIILFQLITGQLGLEGLGGPITTIATIADATQMSWLNLLILFPLISVNLAVFNWLPFPALDGARMVFVLIEWIRRGKPINRDIEARIHNAGLIVLFAFVIFIDIFHFLN